MIEIILNGESKTLAAPMSVAQLLESCQMDPRKVAVEVNREVVPKAKHPQHHLQSGDAVEIVTLVGGGALPPADKPLKVGKFTFELHVVTLQPRKGTMVFTQGFAKH